MANVKCIPTIDQNRKPIFYIVKVLKLKLKHKLRILILTHTSCNSSTYIVLKSNHYHTSWL